MKNEVVSSASTPEQPDFEQIAQDVWALVQLEKSGLTKTFKTRNAILNNLDTETQTAVFKRLLQLQREAK
ncbi:MAG: hypothetical protein ABSF66_03515 [Terriglobales bacterium]|jgi:hypothetical protein